MFSPGVLDHFRNPRNGGELPNATTVVEVTNPVCGDVLRLAVRLEKEHIAEARFQTKGCVASIACSSLLTEMIVGRTLAETKEMMPELPAMIEQQLGGLEPAMRHAAQLARDAVEALIERGRS